MPAVAPVTDTPGLDHKTHPITARNIHDRNLLPAGMGSGKSSWCRCALGEQCQERVCFSHDVQRGACLGQFVFQAGVVAAQPFQLNRFRGALRPSGGLAAVDEPGRDAGVTGFAPIDDVGVIEPFAAQQGALLAVAGRGLVLGQDPCLVLGGERPTGRSGVQAVLDAGLVWHR